MSFGFALALLVLSQPCRSDSDCAAPKLCACERRIDCTWWPPGSVRVGEKMTYVQIARRTNESACLTEREALDARATLADPQGQEILRDCYADHQCPTGQLCVCGYAECSRRVVAAYYMNPRRPPYTTHMCLPKDAKNDLVRKCGTRSTDRCLSVDGGTPTPQSAVIALPTAPPVDAGWVMPRKDGGS